MKALDAPKPNMAIKIKCGMVVFISYGLQTVN